MERVESGEKQRTRCATCGQSTPGYDIVSCGSIERGYRQLCSQCFNTELAISGGLDKFEHVSFHPVEIADSIGEVHLFYFRTHLFGTGVALDAFELRDGHPAGYQFQVIASPKVDPLVVLARLIEKMRRALSVQHVQDGKYGMKIADHQVVQGMIEWDAAEDGHVPLLVVDGRGITWEEFGHMMMTFEGWQFKLEIRDKSEEF